MTMHIVLLKDSILRANNFTSLHLIPNVGVNYQGSTRPGNRKTISLFLDPMPFFQNKNNTRVPYEFPLVGACSLDLLGFSDCCSLQAGVHDGDEGPAPG